MTINTEDLLNSILESVGRIDYIHPVDIPNIDLYMDQVIQLFESKLSNRFIYGSGNNFYGGAAQFDEAL